MILALTGTSSIISSSAFIYTDKIIEAMEAEVMGSGSRHVSGSEFVSSKIFFLEERRESRGVRKES